MFMRLVAAAAAALLLGGCYSTVPLETGVDPQPGMQVVMVLAMADGDPSNPFGTGAQSAKGTIQWVRADSLALKVDRVDFGKTRPAALYHGQEFVIPRGAVASMSQRKASTGKSVLLGVGIAGGLIVLGKALGLDGVFGSGDSGGPDIDN